ncbi:glycosyltransferase family 4 protein [uncultured Psychroserpens sp.]|uniref:glycosyltransferase family 4 protein n=1 Tax=uncultured Psychroserpens sp. TaxID=255436 RepID=UPI00260C0F1F|nr:glycosyltransferase family 4 protein [uncultured Psychroserpens sp.]
MKKILIIGPIPEPTTGVSLANKVVADNLIEHDGFSVDTINTSYNKFDENLGAFSLSKFLFYLKLNFFAYKIFKANIIYITPGQTFFGVVKYTLFIALSKLAGKELITHIHGNYVGKEYGLLKGLKKQIFKILLSKTSKGIVLSESLTGNMSPFIPKDNIFVLYNFVENYLFPTSNEVKEKVQSFKKPKIVFLSNLMEEKGIFALLEALKILENEGVDYEAKIAGHIDASNKDKVTAYFDDLKHTTYCGVVRGQEKKDLLIWANTFILPTWYTMEGQPISILEAMATANVVLTTNHAGIPDIFKASINGFYVNKNDPNSIVNMVKTLSDNHESSNKIQEHNFNEAKEKYKVKSFIDNAVSIFRA